MSLIWPAQPMRDPDTFVTDFAEYSTGAQPPDWTVRWNTVGYTAQVQTTSGSKSGKALRINRSVDNLQMLSWDKIPLVANVEILTRSRCVTMGGGLDMFCRPAARLTGAAGLESGYIQPAFYHGSAANKWRTQCTRYVTGTAAIVNGAVDVQAPTMAIASPSVWVWQRFRLSGTSIQYKAWQDGQSEPAFASFVDSGVTAAGWAGLTLSNSTLNSSEIDFFSVALSGKTAPSVRK